MKRAVVEKIQLDVDVSLPANITSLTLALTYMTFEALTLTQMTFDYGIIVFIYDF